MTMKRMTILPPQDSDVAAAWTAEETLQDKLTPCCDFSSFSDCLAFSPVKAGGAQQQQQQRGRRLRRPLTRSQQSRKGDDAHERRLDSLASLAAHRRTLKISLRKQVGLLNAEKTADVVTQKSLSQEKKKGDEETSRPEAAGRLVDESEPTPMEIETEMAMSFDFESGSPDSDVDMLQCAEEEDKSHPDPMDLDMEEAGLINSDSDDVDMPDRADDKPVPSDPMDLDAEFEAVWKTVMEEEDVIMRDVADSNPNLDLQSKPDNTKKARNTKSSITIHVEITSHDADADAGYASASDKEPAGLVCGMEMPSRLETGRRGDELFWHALGGAIRAAEDEVISDVLGVPWDTISEERYMDVIPLVM